MAVKPVNSFDLVDLGAAVVAEAFFFQWKSFAAAAAAVVVVLVDIDPSSAAAVDGIDSTVVAVLNMYLHHLIYY